MSSRKGHNKVKKVLGFAAGIGGGIIIAKLIMNKLNPSKEIYTITVDFED